MYGRISLNTCGKFTMQIHKVCWKWAELNLNKTEMKMLKISAKILKQKTEKNWTKFGMQISWTLYIGPMMSSSSLSLWQSEESSWNHPELYLLKWLPVTKIIIVLLCVSLCKYEFNFWVHFTFLCSVWGSFQALIYVQNIPLWSGHRSKILSWRHSFIHMIITKFLHAKLNFWARKQAFNLIRVSFWEKSHFPLH